MTEEQVAKLAAQIGVPVEFLYHLAENACDCDFGCGCCGNTCRPGMEIKYS